MLREAGRLSFWDTTLNRLGLQRVSKAAPVQPRAGRVPWPIQSGQAGGAASLFGSIKWFGDGLEGYDALLSSGAFDYDTAIGNYDENSAVQACLEWLITSWATTTLQVGVMQGSEFIPDAEPHPLTQLVNSPHPDYDGGWLWALLLTDFWAVSGNHYWNIVRAGKKGAPIEIQFLQGSMTTPYSSGNDPTRLYDFYRYTPNGDPQDIEVERVVHFPFYLPSPADPRVGRRPLYSARREIYTDNKAADVAAAIMRKPRPSGILTPESSDVEIPEDAIRQIKQAAEEISGDNAGGIFAMGAGTKYVKLSYDPKELALDEARRKPEERICAIFGIHPAIVGLGAGLDRSTYSNMAEARLAAWQDCLIPLQDYIAGILTKKLLPMFPGSEGKVVMFDRSQVGALQQDVNAIREQARADVVAGIITVEEARGEAGRPSAPVEGTLQPRQEQPNPAQQVNSGTANSKAFSDVVLKVSSQPEARIYRAVSRLRDALSRDEESALSELAGAYNGAYRKIADDLASLVSLVESIQAEGKPLSESRLALIDRMESHLSQIEGQLLDLADRGAAITEQAQRTASTTATGHTEGLARAMMGTPPPGSPLVWNTIPTEAFEAFVGLSGSGSPLSELFVSAGKEYAREIHQQLLTGLLEGRNPKQVAAAVAGATGANRARMETICRTEMLRASREATRRTYEANSSILNGYIRLSAADARTCPACWALHGTKSATAERFPQHPNCRCTLVPDMKSYAEILGDSNIPDNRPVVVSGEDLFALLSQEEQARVLGAGRYGLYSQGVPLSDFVHREYDPEWGPTVTTETVSAATMRAGVSL